MSATVSLSRKELWITAILMLPCFLAGEWAKQLVFGTPFSGHDVYEGFWGVLTFATVLSFTRAS